MADIHPQLMEFGIATRGLGGAAVSGDLHWVRQDADRVLVAVIDGLGHGSEAAAAATAAASALTVLSNSVSRSVSRIVADCHAALLGTRGAVMALAVLDARSEVMSWLAVGNIEGMLMRQAADGTLLRHSLRVHAGIVGYRLPRLHPTTIPLQADDLVALATDGIRDGFEQELRFDLPPQGVASHILANCATEEDDALIFVGRWIGSHGRRL